MQPPPAFRSENPNELGHTEPSGWTGCSRIFGYIGSGVAVVCLIIAFLSGPLAFAITLLVAGFFLVSMIYLPRKLRFTQSGVLWILFSGCLIVGGLVGLYHENNLVLWLAYGAAVVLLL